MASYKRVVYLDHAATTPVLPEVFSSMKPYLTARYGNPSASYTKGEESLGAIEHAREIIAEYLHARPEEIYFTSGGSESDNWALKGVADYNRFSQKRFQCHMMTSSIEHHAILNSTKYLERKGVLVDYLPVDGAGFIDMRDVAYLANANTTLISVMFANNEIGTIEPVAEIGAFAKKRGIVFHTDAVQAFGQVEINVEQMNIDMLSASAHKLGGPKGVGILYVRKGCRLEPFIHGGGQEQGRRAGTENVAAIVGMGKATEIAMRHLEQKVQYVSHLRDELYWRIQELLPECRINGAWPDHRLPGNLNITIPGVNATELVAKLDAKGILVSTASACSTHDKHPSHVLQSIGLHDEEARSTIRMTLGTDNTLNQMYYVASQLRYLCEHEKSS